MPRFNRLLVVALAVLGAAAPPASEQATTTAAVVATGASGVRLTLKFSEAMVPLGDPRAAAPAQVTCPATGEGRWADPSTWVWEAATKPRGGIGTCAARLNPGLRTQAGTPVADHAPFVIDAGGPTALAILPNAGNSAIEEGQSFVVAVNGPVDRASVPREAYCAVDGIGERIGVDLLPAEAGPQLIGQLRGWEAESFLSDAGISTPLPTDARGRAGALSNLVALRCHRPLPPGRDAALVWGTGIRAPDGTLAGRDQRFDFSVRAEFTARWECSRVNPRAGCSPVEAATVSFSAPVRRADAMAIRLDVGGGHQLSPKEPQGTDAEIDSISFAAPLPAGTDATLIVPPTLRDVTGRPLANARRFPLPVRIDVAPPLVKFAAPFGILEAREGGVLPVTVRAVEPRLAGSIRQVGGQTMRVPDSDKAIADWLRRVEKTQEADFREEKHGDATVTVNHTGDTALLPKGSGKPVSLSLPAGGKAFEVVGMPLGRPGFYVVELASPTLGRALLGRDAPRYVAAGALVTNMAVHFKWGRGSSLAWVTALDTGKPVAGADVHVSDSCTGRQLASGTTDRWGRLGLAVNLPAPSTGSSCDIDEGSESSPPLMVSARKDGDLSFVRTDWGSGIQPYDFDLSFGWSAPEPTLRAVTDRALVRAGETVNMTFVYRRPLARGFGSGGALKGTLKFRHLGSDTVFEQPLALDARGMGEASWTPPKGAPNGDYAIAVAIGDKTIETNQTIDVDEYRLPTMRASVSGPKQAAVRPKQLPLDLFVGFLSGGGAGRAPVALRAAFSALDQAPPGWDDWTFGGAPVKEGTEALDEEGSTPTAKLPPARTVPLALGANGALRTSLDVPQVDSDTRATIEMDYQDANGETLTTSTRVPLYAAALRVAIRPDGWLQRQDALHLKLAALSLDGKPLAGKRVSVQLYTRETISARRRLIGGFYAFDNSVKTTKTGAHCSATTDAHGIATCTINPGVSGEVYAQATASDDEGRVSRAVSSVWLVGDDDWWFGGDNGDRMDLVPDAKAYKVGDVAHLQVRMPFREATGLITIEREGVMRSQVVALSGKDPVVDVKLEQGDGPDVYVSVMAVRGRIAGWKLWFADFARRWHLPFFSREGASPTALVDLAKPSYRLGIAKLTVGWEANRLAVKVVPDRTRYHIRDLAQVAVQVTAPGGHTPASAEIAFAAVDEGLLTLAPNDSWALLDAMMAERPLSVLTATAQMQVVGKRHYGRKAVAAGGGGGDTSAMNRSDFRPVLLWRGRVPLDPQGRAHLAVPLADALSAYKLVAVATAGSNLFGTGEAEIRTVQELTVYPGVPPLVRGGDRFGATFTLRNGTDRPMTVTATATLTPRVAQGHPLTVTIPAGGAVPVTWNLAVPDTASHIQWTVEARSVDGRGADRVSVGQEVIPAVPAETWAATLVRVNGATSVPIAPPAGALAGRSSVEVAFRASVAPPLSGVRDYMHAYPYGCFEQRLSKAVALGDGAAWAKLASELPAYQAPDGLVRYWPGDSSKGSVVLTAYALSMTAEAGLPLPDAAKAKMLDAMRGVVDGRITEEGSGPSDRRLLRVSALAALARHGGAVPGQFGQVGLAPAALPTALLADWIVALDHTPGVDPRLLPQALATLRSRIVYEGTRLDLTDRANAPWWMMVSDDEMAAKALLAIAGRAGWESEAPRMAVGLGLRQLRGHWDTTPANAWGTIAAHRFDRAYPPAALSGSSTATLGSLVLRRNWPMATDVPPLAVPLPGPGSLLLRHDAAPGPWATVAVKAAVPLTRPLFAGYRVTRSVAAVQQRVRGRWSQGDVARVTLVIDAGVDRVWVALSDPLPAGASVIGGQATQSAILAGSGDASAGATPAYSENGLDAFRAYYDWLPRGRTTVSYALRLNSAGRFQLPPTHVEAMYSPEIHASLPNVPIEVSPR